MAEFTEVCRQAMRMGEAYMPERCDKLEYIALYISKNGKVALKGGGTTETAEEIEKHIMQWAAEHPEPVYPTWEEWSKANFPKAARPICMLNFTGREACADWDRCCECLKERIPADIAAKLGVKPIKNKGGAEK